MQRKFLVGVIILAGVFGLLQKVHAGYTSFPAGSVIVPMDPCWQPNSDTAMTGAFRPSGCDGSTNNRGIFQAYGMVYELLRNGGKVAWVVKPTKTDENDFDFTIAGIQDPGAGQIGPPVNKYNRLGVDTRVDPPARTVSWTLADGSSRTESFDAHVIDYRGGPFIIHKKYLNPAMWAIIDNFPNVKTHVSNVSFTAPIDKVLDKIPPKLAIIGGKYTAILRDYLLAAGLGASESLVFEEVTPLQIIEDGLTTPDASGNSFSLFWAPHWEITSEVRAMTRSDGTILTTDQAQRGVLSKLRAFIEAGNSAFLECASIESVEGSENGPANLDPGWDIWTTGIQDLGGWLTPNRPANWTTAIPAGGDPPGARLWTNNGSNNASSVINEGPTNFLAQCAGWDYKPTSGHVHNYQPHDHIEGLYNDSVERFLHDEDGSYQTYDPGFDYYVGGRINGSPTQGYVSYLAGHRYLECNSSGTESNSTAPVVTVGPRTTVAFDLAVPGTLPTSETISFAVYYDGGTSPVVARFNADGSGALSGDDATLEVNLRSLASAASGSNRTYGNIIVSNMSTTAHTIDRINVTWSGCASSTPSGGGEYVIKKENVTNGKFCDGNNTPEGETCTPDRTVRLTRANGLEFGFEVLEEIVDNDWLFLEFGYAAGQTARLGLQLDRSNASAGNKTLTLRKTSILPECSDRDSSQLAFDLSQLQVKILYTNNARTKFQKIQINNVNLIAPTSSSQPNITSITATWGDNNALACSKPPSTAICSDELTVSSMVPAFTVSAHKSTDIATAIGLEALNDGGVATGDPPPDLIDVSYCDPKWNNTNTCGTRYVLNTVLGLQFTVISNTYVQSSPILDRGIAFQGSYEFPTYRGHMQAISVLGNPDGTWDSSAAILWDAANVMPPAGTGGNPENLTSNPASRYIFTNNGSTLVEFEIASVTQASDYLQVQLGKTTLDDTQVLINTVRGRDKATPTLVNGTGEQPYRLWGIRTSSPAVVGRSILANQLNRDRIVYAGGDDGMLHAFFAGTWDSSSDAYSNGSGQEIWAYIPSTLLANLKKQSYVDPTKDPKVSVSGSPSVRDFLFPVKDAEGNVTGVEYKTLLLGTATIAEQNRGVVFALDITNPYEPKILWETDLSPYNIGDASGVSLGKVRDGDGIRNWAFLTANFHEPLNSSGLPDQINGSYGINALALDVFTGVIKWQWQQAYAINNVSATPSMPSLLDLDDNGVVDYLVFGDMDGRLWQLDAKQGHSVHTLGGAELPVYVPTDGDGNPLGTPIGASVSLYKGTAIFGTGGTDFADDRKPFGLYAVSLGEREANLVWKAESKDASNEEDFLLEGEKIWGAPMIDSSGRIYVATGKGYQQQGTDTGNTVDQNTASSGKVHVLDSSGELLTSVATQTASVGSVALADGGAVATDFTGNLIRFGNPTGGGTSQGIRVKVFSWRVR